jgi:nitric oxide reductase NorD protein
VTFQLHLDILGTYRFPAESVEQLPIEGDIPQQYSDFFNRFANQRLARDLFFLVESVRILATLHKRYPGLMQDVQAIFAPGETCRPPVHDQNSFVEALEHCLLACIGKPGAAIMTDDFILPEAVRHHYFHAETVVDSLQCLPAFYNACLCQPGVYSTGLQLPFLGKLCFSEAKKWIDQRRVALQESFMKALGAQIHEELQKAGKTEGPQAGGVQSQEKGKGALLAMAANSEAIAEEIRPEREVFRIGTMELDLSDELLAQARQIFKEFGKIPGDFIASAIGRAGDLFDAGCDEATEDENAQPVSNGAMLYDEWDYRRAGYRKNWCRVTIKDVLPVTGNFVETTLCKYKGVLVNLRRQFEMMSVQEKYEKRQREGDEIDFDAVIDSVSDTRAGLPPSERLFIRLQRNERQIAALFLVDMSSSTEGWVSTALKEALILMSESLAVLGDGYAIYGFSGMRRTRSELFTIKHFDEPYGEAVKNKISGISPKEYTRMGPAIRHASHILAGCEAKIRLLIILSDGKPEDYDGYKGAYAIEDTRHALIEAKSKGIHPFCITVDKEAHEYMDHMYGEVNYIFIDRVVKLPLRMPEIYRNLTT